MGRVKITEAVLGRQQSGVAVLLDGASVQVNDSNGDPATVYEEAVGGTTLSNPLTSEDGRLPGFVDEGYYELVVTYPADTGTPGDPVPFEARAAYPAAPSGSTSLLSNDGAGTVEWIDPNDAVGLVPWTIDIDPFTTPATQTDWSSITVDTSQAHAAYLRSTVQNAEIGWDVVLGAGTWTVSVLTVTTSGSGIITVSLDGVTQGTIDTYSGSTTYNVVKTLSGIDVDTTGKKRLLFKMATQNGAASGYIGQISGVRLLRTA